MSARIRHLALYTENQNGMASFYKTVFGMIVGRVVAASVDKGCTDANGYLIWDKLKPAHYCGHEYKSGFVAAYQKMDVDMVYKEPIPPRNS